MAESELIKESRKAALRRTDKMYEKNKKKIESLKKDYKDADFTEDDYIKGRDSTITGIKKDIKGTLSPKSKKQRLNRKRVELERKNERLSDFLFMNDLGVDSPIAVVPKPTTTSSYNALSVEAVETLIYHWFSVVLYWIGCPISPEFLSDTRLTTFNDPPKLLMVNADAFLASVSVFANFMSFVVVRPLVAFAFVIAK